MLTGGCGCGAVRFEVQEPLAKGIYCHCKRCQRRSGTAASANVLTEPGAFRIIAGDDHVQFWRPDDGNPKAFCELCGSALYSERRDAPGVVAVRMGAFDEDPGVEFVARVWLSSAADWEPVPDDGLKRFDGPLS